MLTSILLTIVVYFLHQKGLVPDWVFYSSIILAVSKILLTSLALFLKTLEN